MILDVNLTEAEKTRLEAGKHDAVRGSREGVEVFRLLERSDET